MLYVIFSDQIGLWKLPLKFTWPDQGPWTQHLGLCSAACSHTIPSRLEEQRNVKNMPTFCFKSAPALCTLYESAATDVTTSLRARFFLPAKMSVKIYKDMYGHRTQRPDGHTFLCTFWHFQMAVSCLSSIGSIYTKLKDFVKLGLLFMTMWINSW